MSAVAKAFSDHRNTVKRFAVARNADPGRQFFTGTFAVSPASGALRIGTVDSPGAAFLLPARAVAAAIALGLEEIERALDAPRTWFVFEVHQQRTESASPSSPSTMPGTVRAPGGSPPPPGAPFHEQDSPHEGHRDA